MVRAVYGTQIGNYPVFIDYVTKEHILPVAPVVFTDDFLGIDVVQPATAESGVDWLKKLVGTGTATVGGVSNGLNGKVAIALNATSEKGEGTFYFGDNRQYQPTAGLVAEWVFDVAVLPTGTAVLTVGVAGTWVDNPDAVIRSAWFKIMPGGTVFAEIDDGTTDKSASTGLVLGTAVNKVGRIDFQDPTNVRFYMDGVDVTPTGTTFGWAATGADGQVQPWAQAYKSTGVGVGTLNVDKFTGYQRRA